MRSPLGYSIQGDPSRLGLPINFNKIITYYSIINIGADFTSAFPNDVSLKLTPGLPTVAESIESPSSKMTDSIV